MDVMLAAVCLAFGVILSLSLVTQTFWKIYDVFASKKYGFVAYNTVIVFSFLEIVAIAIGVIWRSRWGNKNLLVLGIVLIVAGILQINKTIGSRQGWINAFRAQVFGKKVSLTSHNDTYYMFGGLSLLFAGFGLGLGRFGFLLAAVSFLLDAALVWITTFLLNKKSRH